MSDSLTFTSRTLCIWMASESQTWIFLQESLQLFARCFRFFLICFDSNVLLKLYPHMKNSEWDSKSHPNHSLLTDLTKSAELPPPRAESKLPNALAQYLPSSCEMVPCKHIQAHSDASVGPQCAWLTTHLSSICTWLQWLPGWGLKTHTHTPC